MRTLLEEGVEEGGAAAFDLLHCVGNLKMRKRVKQKCQRQTFQTDVKDILFEGDLISDH